MENYYHKKSIWKWIILYVIIGAIAYGLIYYFFFYKNRYSYNNQETRYNNQTNSDTQNSNSQTADWKTYKNDKYGYEFKYPNAWYPNNLEKTQKADSFIASFTRPFDVNNLANDPSGDTIFTVWVPEKLYIDIGHGINDTEEKDVNKYFQYRKNEIKNNKNVTYYKEINFNGYNAVYSKDKNNLVSYEFIRNNRYYGISFGYKEKSDGIGEKIIFTLKFTK